MTWKPISSAPRDGTSILTWHDFGANCQNQISDHFGKRGFASFQRAMAPSYERYPSDIGMTGSVTHWMHIDPPKETDDGR